MTDTTHEPRFKTSESEADEYTFAEMVDANIEDIEVRDWLYSARVGDALDTMHGARVERVQ